MALEGDDGHAFDAPFGSFAQNAWNLYGMHGNAWGWASDWHDDNCDACSPIHDSQGPDTGDVRVRRGGSWHTCAFYARSSCRSRSTPGTRCTLVGIQLVRDDWPLTRPMAASLPGATTAISVGRRLDAMTRTPTPKSG